MPSFLHLYQLCMILNCLLNSLRLNADVPLRGGCTTMLKEPLHQCYVKAVCVVDFGCVPFAEAVGADPLEAQVIADNMQLLLHSPFCDGEHQFCLPYAISQTVVFDVLVYDHGNSEHSALACLLLYHFKTIAIPIPYNIALPQFQNIADAQT